MAKTSVEIRCDGSPLLMLLELAQRCPQLFGSGLNLSNFPDEIARVEQHSDPADATKILVRLYPSDSFLDFLAAIFASDSQRNLVE